MKDITAIICCYNSEKVIAHTLNTILEQKNIESFVEEIIVVDNNSNDSTKDIIISYNQTVIPVRYVFEANQGLSNARRCGILECKTKWIAFIDDDNFLDDGWFEKVSKYIYNNPSVGAFNGAVIPHVNYELSQEEKRRLKASLKVLACTHLDKDEVNKNPKTPFRNPIGAGMVILCEPLKALIELGWLDSAGRTKDNLTSGEDGEMAFWVKNKGYEFGFCPEAIIHHNINRNRLEDDYLRRMWYEIGRGVAIVAKKQKKGWFQLFLYRVLIYLRLVIYSLQDAYLGKYYRIYIEGYKNEL